VRLYLVRHGKAEPGGDDEARRLTDRGRKDVQRTASALRAARVQVDRIDHSGLARAAETSEILASALDAPAGATHGLAPMDDVAAAARRLESVALPRLMLVGHQPFMSRLAAYLLTGRAAGVAIHLPTAAVVHLSNDERAWELEWLLVPDLIVPFPVHNRG
jgi:phosphohistidine phosphatase